MMSYRMYGHLTDSDQRIFDKYKGDYDPYIRSMALYANKKLKTPISKKLFDKCQAIFPKWYWEFYKWYSHGINTGEVDPNYLFDLGPEKALKELKFHGFKRVVNTRMKEDYGYFSTNRQLDGSYWVYPKRFADNSISIKEGKYPYYQDHEFLIGVPGYTKYNWSHMALPF